MQEQYTLEEWIGMLEEAGLDEAEVMKITPELQAAIKKYRETPTHNPKQHAKVMPAVKTPKTSESYSLEEWMGMLEEAGYDTEDMDEGKLSRLAAGLGLAGAAMMGGAKDAGAQQATPTKAPTDSVQTATSRDMQLALNKAGTELDRLKISRQGARQDVRQNPDGTFTATIDARKRPATQAGGAPQMEERYSLEEWLGMLEEAGYSLEEGSVEDETSALKAALSAKGSEKTLGKGMADIKAALQRLQAARKAAKTNESYTLEEWMGMLEEAGVNLNELSPETLKSYVKASKADMQKNLAKSTEKTLHVPGRARATKRFQGQIAAFKKLGGDPDLAESYTLEEWMGALEEAGYDVSEYSLWRPKESGAKSTGVMKDPKKPKTPPAEPTKPKKKLDELSPELMGRYMDKAKSQVSQNIDKVGYNKQYKGGSGFDQAQRAAKDAKRIKGMTTALGSMDKQLQQRYNNPQGNTDAEKAAHQKSTVDKFDRAADNLSKAKEYSKMAAESINENTVARLQQLAGITPTE